VYEWNEQIVNRSNRGLRGGSFAKGPEDLAAAFRDFDDPTEEGEIWGFRLG